MGTDKSELDQMVTSPAPTAPSVPATKHKIQHRSSEEDDTEGLAAWEECAAILELEDGLNWAEAKRRAAKELGEQPPSSPA